MRDGTLRCSLCSSSKDVIAELCAACIASLESEREQRTKTPLRDPNYDIIGRTFDTSDLGTLTITGTACWSPQYVTVENDDGYRSVRNVEQMRIALRLQK